MFCDVHVNFHGCSNSNQLVIDNTTEPPILMEDRLIRMYGLLEYASSNNIVMFFPQNNE